jgi:hypothetical protein
MLGGYLQTLKHDEASSIDCINISKLNTSRLPVADRMIVEMMQPTMRRGLIEMVIFTTLFMTGRIALEYIAQDVHPISSR